MSTYTLTGNQRGRPKLRATPEMRNGPKLVLTTDNISQLARELGISRQAIYQWRVVPASRVREVARITGIRRDVLRPDLYDRPR